MITRLRVFYILALCLILSLAAIILSQDEPAEEVSFRAATSEEEPQTEISTTTVVLETTTTTQVSSVTETSFVDMWGDTIIYRTPNYSPPPPPQGGQLVPEPEGGQPPEEEEVIEEEVPPETTPPTTTTTVVPRYDHVVVISMTGDGSSSVQTSLICGEYQFSTSLATNGSQAFPFTSYEESHDCNLVVSAQVVDSFNVLEYREVTWQP